MRKNAEGLINAIGYGVSDRELAETAKSPGMIGDTRAGEPLVVSRGDEGESVRRAVAAAVDRLGCRSD